VKLLLGETTVSTPQAADTIKRFARIAGIVPDKSAFARALSWANSLRGNRRQN
jgi:hypothetical protein